jgi:hypothetical protein
MYKLRCTFNKVSKVGSCAQVRWLNTNYPVNHRLHLTVWSFQPQILNY